MVKIKTKLTRHSGHHKPRGLSEHAFEKVYWPYLPLVLAIAGLLTLTGRSGSLTSTLHNPTGRVLSYSTSMEPSKLLADTNYAREKNNGHDLMLNDKLSQAAQDKANDMASRNYWSHNTPEGNPPWVFAIADGYSYQKLGENLATGFNDEQATIYSWLASAPHRQNLLDPSYTQVGFGVANNPNYTAAGGGPMTIIVAFYGEPAGQNAYFAIAHPGPKGPAPNTLASSTKLSFGASTSRAQLAFAGTPLQSAAGEIIGFSIIAALVFWAGRHLRSLRKAWAAGGSFVVRHPLADIGFIIILGLLYILSRSMGFVQ